MVGKRSKYALDSLAVVTRLAHVVGIILLFSALVIEGKAQESYLVPDFNNAKVFVQKLSDNSSVESLRTGVSPQGVVVSPNGRLAFVANVNSGYMSVVDLTIQREIKRIHGVRGRNVAITQDGTRVAETGVDTTNLFVVDTSTLQLIQTISLANIYGVSADALGSVVTVGHKAYVNSNRPAGPVAIVDLDTFAVSVINNSNGIGSRRAGIAATPDGLHVLAVRVDSGLSTGSILVIDTGTGTISQTITLGTAPKSIAIPANSSPANTFGYVTTGGSVFAIDLRPGLTFGQVVQGATATLPLGPSFIAANSDGSRVVVTGFGAGGVNVAVIDTALLLTNPSLAVISQVTIGANPGAVAISTITTQAPATAPVVSGFDSNVVNDAPHTVQITGSNFSNGAQVRFGKLDPVPANVISSGILQAVVPQFAPAQTGADIIVTNTNSAGPVSGQQQSGVLAGQFTISNTPTYQPQNVFAVPNAGDVNFSLLNLATKFVQGVSSPSDEESITMTADGSHFYLTSFLGETLASYNVQTGSIETTIQLPGLPGQLLGTVFAPNPTNGQPNILTDVQTCTNSGCDLQIVVVDADPASQTFNTIISTLPANLTDVGTPGALGVTPDGAFAYANDGNGRIVVYDIAHGSVTLLSTTALGVSAFQLAVYVTPDGKSLLLANDAGGINVFDISGSRTNPTLVTTITGSTPAGLAAPSFGSYQVVGTRLFAYDNIQDLVESFNFDRSAPNFAQTGSFAIPGNHEFGEGSLALTSDGSLLYAVLSTDDAVAVLDANLLASGNPSPLITKVGVGVAPGAIAVSPAASITQPLNPNGGTNNYNFGPYNYKITYPANPAFSGVNLTITAELTPPSAFGPRVAGTQFANAQCIVYQGTGGNCSVFEATCQESGNPIACPSGTSYDVLTSFDASQPITNPAFLKAPVGTNDWTNIFTDFFLQRIDPTVKGKTNGFSDFVAVDLGATNPQGPANLRVLSPRFPSAYPSGRAIPVTIQLTSVVNGSPITDAQGSISVVKIADAKGNPTEQVVLSATNVFKKTSTPGVYQYVLHAMYAAGTYNVTIYGNAFPAFQGQFKILQ